MAEVNGWGGYVKQYEVAINPDRLASFGLTVVDLYKAIEGNNENTGGSYIEQGNNQYLSVVSDWRARWMISGKFP